MASKAKPNILLFFTDQQRFDTIAALGNPVISTPNLDRLANSGVAFTSAYTPSPVCVSARCSMHYGQYPANTNCYENAYPMPNDKPSFMDILTADGYRTHGIGKCHFTPDNQALRGFQTRQRQEEIIGKVEDDDYLQDLHAGGFKHVCDPHGVRGSMYYIPQVAQIPANLHPTQWIGDQTVKFVDEHENDRQPWMCFSSFVHPHPPFAPPTPWHRLYTASEMPLPNIPEGYEKLHINVNKWQNRSKYRDGGWDINFVQQMKAYYYACISFVDFQIGKVLDTLESTNQLENTLIIYASDHGEHLGDYHCFGKRSYHDSAMRVPLLASLPGTFDGGLRCDKPVSLVDIAPTILAAANVDQSAIKCDGLCLKDVVSGASTRKNVFAQLNSGSSAVYSIVSDKWKYVYSCPDQLELLFDRVQDPKETLNLAELYSCRDGQKQMKEDLITFLRDNGETDALNNARDDWRIYPLGNGPNPKIPCQAKIEQIGSWPDLHIEGYSR